MTRRIGHLAGLALLLAITSPAVADVNDGLHLHYIVDSFSEGVSGQSQVMAAPDSEVRKVFNNIEGYDHSKEVTCETLTSGACATPTGLSMRIYLPRCSATTTTYCIEGLAVSAAKGAPLVDATYLGESGGRRYPADPSRGFPEAGAPSLWSVPGAKHAGGQETYAVKLMMDAFLLSTSKSLYIFDVSAVVEGYTESSLAGVAGSSNCTSWQRDSDCGRRTDFVEGQRVALTVRLPNTVTGWLNGRLKDSAITVAKFDDTQNRLRVEAEPVLVPEVSVTLTDAEFSTIKNPGLFRNPGGDWVSVNSGNGAALDWIVQLAPVMQDRASGEHTSWAFSTISNRGGSSCLDDKSRLIGLVTTNAAAYEPGSPSFNNGYLNYRVGGLHYRPDGKSLTIGTYDLLIRSDVARCLYNFTNAPLSATVSVSYGNGSDQQVATTVLAEKDGWLHLAAYGFTFSTPTLKVALKGTRATSKKPSASKQSGTTCVKGKSTKQVPAKVCPVGWKIKR